MAVTVGVLALQGAFFEHLRLLREAAVYLGRQKRDDGVIDDFVFTEVRNLQQLSNCDALIIPGGESTTMALVAANSGLLEPLRDFVKYVSFSMLDVNPLTMPGSSENRPGAPVPA